MAKTTRKHLTMPTNARHGARLRSETALEHAVRGVRDERRIHQPAEIPNEFQTGRKRFLTLCADRPSTSGTHSPRRHKNTDQQEVSAGSSFSIFPPIHESFSSREAREQKTRLRTARTRLTASREESIALRPFQTARGRLQSVTTTETTTSHIGYDHAPIVQSLDSDGLEALHRAFQQMGHMDEEEFATEMLTSLKVDGEQDEDRVGVVAQLIELFRRVDMHTRGEITWDDFSNFISQSTDVVSALEDTVINKYHGAPTPSPLNCVAEIDGLIYLPEVDQMMIHNARGKGFQLYDPTTHRLRTTPSAQKASRKAIVDAVYTPHGRYIVTASSSPVLSFYDVESLQLRQQIPTHCYQTALALHTAPTPNDNVLYSAGSDGDVHAWDLCSLTHRHAFFGPPRSGQSASIITDLAVLPACALLACASMDGGIYMIDLIGGKVLQTMRGHTKGVTMIGYCAENNYLVSGGIDHKLQVWNPHLDQKVGSLSAHHHQLIGLHVRPNSPEVITADANGMMKIWDMRKFAAVQTIVKEVYVRDHNTPVTRSMTAMCYIESYERIAIGHSSIFFLDSLRTKSSSSMSEGDQVGVVHRGKQHELEKDEANKPLHVSFNAPLRMFLAVTRRHVVSWNAATGSRVRSTPIPLRVEATCVATMEDGYSCFVGCEDGSVARLMLPSAAVVVHKLVHKHGGEVSSVRLLDHDRLILTCGNDGNVIVSHWETLQVANILNHWRGLQSVRSFYSDSSLLQVYSVPLSVRSFFMGNEIDRLTAAFAQADPTRSGKIAVSALPSVLERAFPSSTTSRSSSQPDLNHCREDSTALTFAMFIDVVKDSLCKTTVEGGGLVLSGISAFDVHPTLGTLVTTSSDEAEFCMWNLKNGAVMGDGRIRSSESPQRQSIAIVRYLHPLPFFVCVEDHSSCFSIWSSRALPPVTTLPNACILRYNHSHSGGRESLMSATTFLTEPNKIASDAKPVLIRSLAWFSSDNGKKLLCVGDEAGHIQLLDLQPVMRRIEEVNTTRQPSADPSLKGLLSASLLQKVHRWSTTSSNNVGVRFLHVQNIEYLVQPNTSNHTVVVSMGDLGSVTLWSLDGQLLGRLQDEGVHRHPWKLCLDAGELQQKTRESAIAILRHVEKRQVTSLNQQEDSGRRRSPVSQMHTLSSNGTHHHSNGMPLQSSKTLFPSRPPGRRSSLSAEDKLVAWRQSMHSKPPIGLQSRRSLRVSTPQARVDTTSEPVTRPGSPPKEKELDEGIEDTTVEGADLGNPATIPDSSS